MHKNPFHRTRLACFSSYFTMSSVFCLPALLFTTFHECYGISYTLLGTLVLTNFCTQLTVDMIFTLLSKHFNIKKVIRIMPLFTCAGLMIYALVPLLVPQHAYFGLVMGTIVFSISAGLSEVLLSPVVAAIPSDNPQGEMSLLHSLYAFGVLTVVILSTLFLRVFGHERWFVLVLVWAALPIVSSVLFWLSPMPNMDAESSGSEKKRRDNVGLMALFVACIFFGSCAENAMGNWISSFMEKALHIDKTVGDIFGVAMFAILLGIARMSYAKYAKHIYRVLLVSMICAAACYLVAGFASGTVAPFVACIFTGFFTAMLWPGSLIIMEEHIPHVGVAAYALMAAGGDLGASLAPQLLGIVVDRVAATPEAVRLGQALGLTPDQIGLKAGMIVSSLFPIVGMAVLIALYFRLRKTKA